MKKSEKIPKLMQEKYDEIVAITDAFSEKHLNNEYGQLIRYTVAALCRKRPSPIAKGKASTWACGATHAIGTINFLFDRSQEPYIGASELYNEFGVGQSTGQGKSKLIRDLLGMRLLDLDWSLPSRMSENPMTWMLMVNGIIIDVRSAPREVQDLAFNKGLIPYIPDDEDFT
jgi:hypothetical protein